VASCLYYLHLNSEGDVQLLEENQNGTSKKPESTITAQKPLPRKPLPESARSSLDVDRQGHITSEAAKSLPIPSTIGQEFRRKPLAGDNSARNTLQNSVQSKEPISRRPLGPRPIISEPAIGRKPLPGVENVPLNPRSSGQGSTSPTRVNMETASSSRSSFSRSGNVKDNRPASNSFSVTLIRRDPSSGAQWNIGKLSGHPVPSGGSDQGNIVTTHSKKPYFNMSIHLTTPGYNYFRISQSTSHIDPSSAGLGSMSAAHNPPPTDNDTEEAQLPRDSEFGFDRQVRMEGSSVWSRPSKQHKRALSDTSGTRNTARYRSSSISSTVGVPEALPDNETVDSGDSKSKGYVFTSPWGGRCKFSTGGSGRTLRCKHTLPGPISASNTAESRFSSQPSVAVSELRFNLPSSALLNASPASVSTKKLGTDSRRFLIPKFGHIRNKISPHKMAPPLPPRPHPTSYAALYPSDEDEEPPPLPSRSYPSSYATDSSDDEAPPVPGRLHPFPYEPNPLGGEEDSRLDLRIGQEKAGGGNRGKRAKYVSPRRPPSSFPGMFQAPILDIVLQFNVHLD
jgi:hypothetical protein